MSLVNILLGFFYDHLLIIAAGLPLNSQCGFQRTRGCADMIFCGKTVAGKD